MTDSKSLRPKFTRPSIPTLIASTIAIAALAVGTALVVNGDENVVHQQHVITHVVSQRESAKADAARWEQRDEVDASTAAVCKTQSDDFLKGLRDYNSALSAWVSAFPYGTLDTSAITADVNSGKAATCVDDPPVGMIVTPTS